MQKLNDKELFRQQALIGGEWQGARSGKTIDVIDPATQSILGTVPDMGRDDTCAAVAAAAKAYPAWRAKTNAERAALLEAWYGLMIRHLDDLARILTLEQGKPLDEAKGEIRYGASFVKWFAEEARPISGTTIPSPTTDRRIVVLKEPVGVCGIITPWNFPNAMITRKVAPALAAGCTVVIKPSDFTPYSAVKRVSLELGGNAPFIVFDDADLELAVEGAIASKFRNGGQTCVCANRILVQAGVYDAFTQKLVARVNGMKVGSGLEPGVAIGPMINEAAISKINRHVGDALSKGARIATQPAILPEGSQFTSPVVLTDATTDMMMAHEETFGPVAPLFRFERDEEALAIANATPFGLAAYFYTTSLKRSWHVAEALEVGMVGLNTGRVSTEVAPFGGVKQSGLGREGAQVGIEEYLETKAFHIGGLD